MVNVLHISNGQTQSPIYWCLSFIYGSIAAFFLLTDVNMKEIIYSILTDDQWFRGTDELFRSLHRRRRFQAPPSD